MRTPFNAQKATRFAVINLLHILSSASRRRRWSQMVCFLPAQLSLISETGTRTPLRRPHGMRQASYKDPQHSSLFPRPLLSAIPLIIPLSSPQPSSCTLPTASNLRLRRRTLPARPQVLCPAVLTPASMVSTIRAAEDQNTDSRADSRKCQHGKIVCWVCYRLAIGGEYGQ